MNYELALKLKNAKFPQGIYPNSQYYISPNVIIERKDIFQVLMHDNPKEARTTNEFVYKPTLEDLIEACGDNINSLLRLQDSWCSSFRNTLGMNVMDVEGKSLIEAVANLYLKLHE